jgi:hypothetical protein
MPPRKWTDQQGIERYTTVMTMLSGAGTAVRG